MIIHTSRPYSAAGGQRLAFVLVTLSQGQSSARPVITAGFAGLLCGGFAWLLISVVGDRGPIMRLSSGSAGHWPPLIKASGRLQCHWVCDALWRGLKPKLTCPFDDVATSCGDVSTRSLWNMLLGFVCHSQTSWCLITSQGSLCWWPLLSWHAVTPNFNQSSKVTVWSNSHSGR